MLVDRMTEHDVQRALADQANTRPEMLRNEAWTAGLQAWIAAAEANETRSSVLTIIDYSLPSDARRLWVIDLERGEMLFHERVAHGRNSGGRVATSFSNEEGSKQTSLGAFLTAATYQGKHGRSLRLDGLEPRNDAARQRAIVIHSADYVDDKYVAEHGQAGRSWGCPALDPDVAQQVIDAIAQGSILYAWAP